MLPNEAREHLSLQNCYVHDLDVTSDTSVQDVLSFIEHLTGGRLDVLCNNAGIVYQYPAVDYDMAMVEKLIGINLVGPMRMVRFFHPLLIKARGTILNTGSIAGSFPSVYQAAYCGSKAGLQSYADTLRVELKPLG